MQLSASLTNCGTLILRKPVQPQNIFGKRLGISHSLVAKEIRRIRETILNEYNKIKDNEHLF